MGVGVGVGVAAAKFAVRLRSDSIVRMSGFDLFVGSWGIPVQPVRAYPVAG